MLAETFLKLVESNVVREVVGGVLYPAAVGSAWWALSKLRRWGGSLLDRVGAIEDDLVVLRDGQRARDDANSSGDIHTFECNIDGTCVYASRSLAALFGLNQDEMLGYGWLEAISSAEERRRVQSNWQNAIATGSPYRDSYKVHNRRTGERFIATAHSVVSRNRNKPLRIFGTVERVTAIKTDNDIDFPTEFSNKQ